MGAENLDGRKQCFGRLNDALDIVRKAAEDRKNRLTGERPLIEDYCRGIAKVAFLVEATPLRRLGASRRPASYYAYVAKADVGNSVVWRRGIDVAKAQIAQFRKICRSENEAVLVDDIESIQLEEFEVPSWIRLECFEKANDLFAGEMYASAADGRFKSYRITSVDDGEMRRSLIKATARRRDKVVSHDIQGRPEIVDRVSGDKGELIWNGGLVFRPYLALGGLRIEFENKTVVPFEEGSRLGFEVADVVYGPF